MENNTPFKRMKVGKVICAVWQNEFEGKKYFRYSFQQEGKDKDGKMKYDNSITESGLRDLSAIVSKIIHDSVKEKTSD
jgi:hypothetical protein